MIITFEMHKELSALVNGSRSVSVSSELVKISLFYQEIQHRTKLEIFGKMEFRVLLLMLQIAATSDSLESLSIHDNINLDNLSEIGEVISTFKAVRYIDLSDNYIIDGAELVKHWGALESLWELDLIRNYIPQESYGDMIPFLYGAEVKGLANFEKCLLLYDATILQLLYALVHTKSQELPLIILDYAVGDREFRQVMKAVSVERYKQPVLYYVDDDIELYTEMPRALDSLIESLEAALNPPPIREVLFVEKAISYKELPAASEIIIVSDTSEDKSSAPYAERVESSVTGSVARSDSGDQEERADLNTGSFTSFLISCAVLLAGVFFVDEVIASFGVEGCELSGEEGFFEYE